MHYLVWPQPCSCQNVPRWKLAHRRDVCLLAASHRACHCRSSGLQLCQADSSALGRQSDMVNGCDAAPLPSRQCGAVQCDKYMGQCLASARVVQPVTASSTAASPACLAVHAHVRSYQLTVSWSSTVPTNWCMCHLHGEAGIADLSHSLQVRAFTAEGVVHQHWHHQCH